MIDEINNISRSVMNWLKKKGNSFQIRQYLVSYCRLHKFDLNNSIFSHDNDGGDVFEIKIELIFIFQVISNSPNLNDKEKMIRKERKIKKPLCWRL